MNHSFDVEFAREYGIEEAIMIQNFQFWISKNKANGRHEHDGRTWTYNSAKAMTELMPYLSDRQIRRTLDSLVEKGVLIKGNWNESAYDRTLWFAFADESKFQIGHHHSPKSAQTFAENGDSKTDLNQIENTDTKASAASKTIESAEPKITFGENGEWTGISDGIWRAWNAAYPALNLDRELAKAAAWLLANPKNKKSNYARFLTNWFGRAQDSAPRSGGQYGRGDDNRPRLVL